MLKSTEMNAQQIRNEYLNFFKEREHTIIPRAKLIPNNDLTTLFTGSGMQPLLPYLLGESHPDGVKLANSQTCFRTHSALREQQYPYRNSLWLYLHRQK